MSSLKTAHVPTDKSAYWKANVHPKYATNYTTYGPSFWTAIITAFKTSYGLSIRAAYVSADFSSFKTANVTTNINSNTETNITAFKTANVTTNINSYTKTHITTDIHPFKTTICAAVL